MTCVSLMFDTETITKRIDSDKSYSQLVKSNVVE